MSKVSFLTNEDIWQTLPEIIKSSHKVDAAFAYFGHDGAKLFPLKRGDRLVIDMSLATVKVGGTNPFEIEKLIKRGIQVFTRSNLHAKIVVTDKTVLVGSANVSKNSHDYLDEAAILTNDTITIQRARDFLNHICIEPVLPEYLSQCKNFYRPPHIIGKRSTTNKKATRAMHAKLWMVNLVDYHFLPNSEIEAFETSEEKALALIESKEQSSLSTFHWTHKPKMVDELETGDWIIQCIRHKDKTISVYNPARLILIDHYIRNKKTGKERYVFHLEFPKHGERLNWVKFRKLLNTILSKNLSQPRTIAIKNIQKADDLLRLWTPKGRVSRK